MAKNTQNELIEELNAKYARLIAIQNELRAVFDYKWIKIVGVLAKQFKIDTPILQCLMTLTKCKVNVMLYVKNMMRLGKS